MKIISLLFSLVLCLLYVKTSVAFSSSKLAIIIGPRNVSCEVINQDLCDGNGQLQCDNNIGTCMCDSHYTTHPLTSTKLCNYKQLNYMTAIMLQIFLGYTGAAYFYMRLWVHAACTLSVLILGVLGILAILIYIGVKYGDELGNNNTEKNKLNKIMTCILVINIIWWLIGIALVAARVFTDDNGVDLA
jgi:hypothetical protein